LRPSITSAATAGGTRSNTSVVLPTAHLDHDPSDKSAASLPALCQRCQIIHDGEEHRPPAVVNDPSPVAVLMRGFGGLARIVALVLILSTTASAETRTAQYGAPFCETLTSFRAFLTAIAARDEDAAAKLDGCVWFKAGVKVEVLRDYADFGGGYRVMQIRKHGNGAFVDGYVLSNDLEDVP